MRVRLPISAPRPLVAVGAELKSTFCVARADRAFLSPHLGDLDSELAYRAFLADLELYLAMLEVTPEVIAHDLHPEYLSTKWAVEQDAELVGVQHHHAHAAACLAEHGVSDPALALVFDGTGYGTDGTLWGGELLRCDLATFERARASRAGPAAGRRGRDPRAVARGRASRSSAAASRCRGSAGPLVRNALLVNAPLSSGMGRLFDAVAAVLGVRDAVTYEGQAAIELEQLAGTTTAEPWPWTFGDGARLVADCHLARLEGRDPAEIAAAFHETVAAAAADACATAESGGTVVLSGGSFQNLRLLAATRRALERHGFRVLSSPHRSAERRRHQLRTGCSLRGADGGLTGPFPGPRSTTRMPCSVAMQTACAVFAACSLSRIRQRWVLTVCVPLSSRRAVSAAV